MQPSRNKENQPPPSKRFDYVMDSNEFQELGKGFIPLNTAADMQKCMCLFQDWATEECSLSRRQSSR